ncbi:FHA domain-containing protein [Alloscardovia venturai]|uniref:FHA domain-containing protein n=1 Tax=Alloscardovia venturai TaxID=1769421 RepID=A0ABW2Y244_9BIFI
MTDSPSRVATWSITVNDQTLKVVAPAVVVIGRKPIRPVQVAPGAQRMDVVDETKSMSKNHARIDFAEESAVLTDLNSTNGTYVIGHGNSLLRVPAENPYTFLSEELQGQFGDVKFAITGSLDSASWHEEETGREEVQNLFSYKSEVTLEDAPVTSMSVDDILDLRAGEPTAVFAAQDTRSMYETEEKSTSTDTADVDMREPDTRESAGTADGESADNGEEKYTLPTSVESAVTGLAPVTEDSGYMPVYEAGSVFDRLSRGEFGHKNDVIEIDGHSSDEAKSTRDYNVQFDIAQIPQLRSFLALNPFLYDDLYAWLEAQNSSEVDTALKTNDGYLAWKESAR